MIKRNVHAENQALIRMKSGWNSFVLPIALVVSMFAVILVSSIGMVSRTVNAVHEDMRGRLRVNARTVDTKIDDLYRAIEAVAPSMAYETGHTQAQMLLGMNAMRDALEFDFVVRTNTEGVAFNYLGKENIDLSQRAYIHKALAGARAIEYVSSGAYDTGSSYVIMAVPIFYQGQVVGVFHGSYRTENFVSLLASLYAESGHGCDEISIVSADGTVIASSGDSFNAEALKTIATNASQSAEYARDDIRAQAYTLDGQEAYYYLSRIDAGTDSGWFLVSRMSPDYLAEQTVFARGSTLALMAVAVVITVALLFIVVSRQKLSNEIGRHSLILADALVEAEKADVAKSQFLSRMSHEIRTPLNAVIGYNTLARNEMTEAKSEPERRQASIKVMDCLNKSDIASKHLLTIINDVLDMSAIESGKIKIVHERFDFKGLIKSLTAVFYSQAKAKGVEFEVRFDRHMDEWVIGDQLRVNQVITNLLSNAVKFTPERGKVVLSIHPETSGDEMRVRFDVSDTGIGMSREAMDRLWKPFEQADASIARRFGGTGLGLSITKTLVDLMNGSIDADSEPGEGTVFHVTLSFTRTEQPCETGPYDFSAINALIIDDDANACEYVRLLLTRSGVRSASVTSGEAAIAAVQAAHAQNDPYTMCLVDWRMPNMDGLETIRRIRDIAGMRLPIIVVTAYDFSGIADKAAELGIHSFLSKPLFQSSLVNRLANISGGPTSQSAEMPATHDFTGARVLLAEDNAMNMEIARKILETSGLAVDAAWNGQEALEQFCAAPEGTYRAILLDVQMPVMDGYQATQAIRSLARPDAGTIPIIAMTADAFAENVAESFAFGMNDHISKPIDVPTLLNTLEKYMGKAATTAPKD